MQRRMMAFGVIFLSFFLMVTPAARAGTAIFSPIDGINGVVGILGGDHSADQSAPPDDSESTNDDSPAESGGCGGG